MIYVGHVYIYDFNTTLYDDLYPFQFLHMSTLFCANNACLQQIIEY